MVCGVCGGYVAGLWGVCGTSQELALFAVFFRYGEVDVCEDVDPR